jgi:hypothetical protein
MARQGEFIVMIPKKFKGKTIKTFRRNLIWATGIIDEYFVHIIVAYIPPYLDTETQPILNMMEWFLHTIVRKDRNCEYNNLWRLQRENGQCLENDYEVRIVVSIPKHNNSL